jgi:hypothetical protein
MGQKVIVLAILVFSATGLAACNSDPANSGDEKKKLSEMAEFLGVEFPADAKIIHAGKNDRNNELVYYHIIYTPMPLKFSKPPVAKITAEDSIKNLKKFAGTRKLGKLTDKWKYCYEGNVRKGEWRALQTNFDTGSYLEVEQFYF